MTHTCKPIAIGHAITCETCFKPFMFWGVTTPIVGSPRLYEFPGGVQ
jgi:hypothetical protein